MNAIQQTAIEITKDCGEMPIEMVNLAWKWFHRRNTSGIARAGWRSYCDHLTFIFDGDPAHNHGVGYPPGRLMPIGMFGAGGVAHN